VRALVADKLPLLSITRLQCTTLLSQLVAAHADKLLHLLTQLLSQQVVALVEMSLLQFTMQLRLTMRLQLQSIAQLQSLLDAALVQRLLLLPPLLVVTTVVTVAKSLAVFADQSARVLAKSAADATTAVTNLIVS
jgi:hypothetical protein